MSKLTLSAFAAVLCLAVPVLEASTDTDGRIEAAAKNSYVFQTYLKNEPITVKAANGTVTLSGQASDANNRLLAEQTVAGLPGVTTVINNIQVPNQAAAPAAGSDGWIRAKVLAALIFHRDVRGASTEIDVKNGVVTLKGEAKSLAEKDLATEYAKDVEGVKGVDNQMTVAENNQSDNRTLGQNIDDASITAQVKMSLMTHRSTHGLDTKVETHNGVVTLKGVARTAAEKDLATRYAASIDGVKEVNNSMKVGQPS